MTNRANSRDTHVNGFTIRMVVYFEGLFVVIIRFKMKVNQFKMYYVIVRVHWANN